jgi:VWFA-related protein
MVRARQLLVAFAAAVAFTVGTLAQQQPTFQTRTDVIAVDVSVLDERGQPLSDLTAADFTVRIDGQTRRVVTAEWISLANRAVPRADVRVPEGYASNELAADGRLIVLAIDQPSIPFTAMRPMQDTLFRFVDGLQASDKLAVVGFGQAAPSVSFTTDHDRIKKALTRMPGQESSDSGRHSMGLSTALTFERFTAENEADRCAPRCANQLLETIVARDCPPDNPARPDERTVCKAEILSEARDLVRAARQDAEITIRALQGLLTTLKSIAAPKTLILVSQRFFMDQERDASSRVSELGALAGAARTSIYGVRLEEEPFNIAQGIQSLAPIEDRRLQQQGLETLTSAARGALFNVTGTGAGIFDRILSELSGYYLLGVEPAASDRDGDRHGIDVGVTRRGTTVRSRRAMFSGAVPDSPTRTPRDAATAALAEPFLLTTLPMRAVAFTLRGPDAARLQLLIHLEIGAGYATAARVAVAYAVFDRDGRAADGQVTDSRLEPMLPGMPSPIEYVAGAGVGAGEYTVKVAAADGDRVGSLEFPVRAALLDAGSVKVTDLMAGGPLPPGDLLRPTIGAQIAFGAVQGYLEAYGGDAAALTVTFEIAPSAGDAAILRENVMARPAGADRALFSQMIATQALPPGDYHLRAIVRQGETTVKTLTRAFFISPILGSSAPVTTSTRDLALAVEAKDLMPPFRRDAALRPDTLAPFRARMTAAARPAFEQGITQLQQAAYAEAETSFRRALQQDAESAGPLVYLAACLAAAGYDTQAAAAWQTAIARGTDLPQIYEWLGESLMRDRMFKDALDLFEEASQRFPKDPRFVRSLALLYATTGRGRDAVKTMKRYLDDAPDDQRAAFLAIQWLFNLHRAKVVVLGTGEDLAVARSYATRYAKTSAPDQALVKQWMEFLEKESP